MTCEQAHLEQKAKTSEVEEIQEELVESIENNLQVMHDNFMSELAELVAKYRVNLLTAINYSEFNQTAVEFIGEDNLLIELGLAKAIERKLK